MGSHHEGPERGQTCLCINECKRSLNSLHREQSTSHVLMKLFACASQRATHPSAKATACAKEEAIACFTQHKARSSVAGATACIKQVWRPKGAHAPITFSENGACAPSALPSICVIQGTTCLVVTRANTCVNFQHQSQEKNGGQGSYFSPPLTLEA